MEAGGRQVVFTKPVGSKEAKQEVTRDDVFATCNFVRQLGNSTESLKHLHDSCHLQMGQILPAKELLCLTIPAQCVDSGL